MKKTQIFLMLLFVSSILRAEYNGYYFRFVLEQVNGITITGYGYKAALYLNLDSMENTEYLKRLLDQGWKEWDKKDSMTFYKNLFRYEYQPVWDSSGSGQKYSIYSLSGVTILPFSAIRRIKIEQYFEHTYLIGVASHLEESDTIWMKRNPVKSAVFTGYLCSYQIFVHKNNARVKKILKELEWKQKEIDGLNLRDENGDTDHNKGDEIDKDLYEIIQKLFRYKKLVVIAECTC